MKIKTHPRRVYDRVHEVSTEAADETLGLIQRKLRKLPYATGELASSYVLEDRSAASDAA